MMKSIKLSLLFSLIAVVSNAQIRNIVYVDASSDIAIYTRDEWQESLDQTLRGLDEFETLVFLSNQNSPSISTPDKYVNVVKQLGTVRPERPLADEDLRLLVKALDKYEIGNEVKVMVYTSNETFQPNVDLGRLLYQRICYLFAESVNSIELNYFLHQSDTSTVFAPSPLFDIKQTKTYF
jgi:hypothetical protein